MAAKKKVTKSKTKVSKSQEIFSEKDNSAKRSLGFADYFNFTESYTSLILGIVVVIIISLLLVSFFKNRHFANMPRQEISATSTVNEQALLTVTPSPKEGEELAGHPSDTPVVTIAPTASATPTQVPSATPVPTRSPSATSTPVVKPTNTPVPTKEPTQIAQQNKLQRTPKSYTVQKGDSLWNIAEKVYGDGYKWVDIAKANNLNNPGTIYSDLKLTLPQESRSVATTQTQQSNAPPANAIKGDHYTIMHGDDLWDIAVRAYGNGYRWVDIAKANKLTNPGLIHSANVLIIPR